MIPIEFLYFDGCPSYVDALHRLNEVLAEENLEAAIEITRIDTEEQAQLLRFTGSPTILIAGQDIDPPNFPYQYGLSCRVYRWHDGRVSPIPSPEMIRQVLQQFRSDDRYSSSAQEK